jgi:hypothetical protein
MSSNHTEKTKSAALVLFMGGAAFGVLYALLIVGAIP